MYVNVESHIEHQWSDSHFFNIELNISDLLHDRVCPSHPKPLKPIALVYDALYFAFYECWFMNVEM